MFLLSSSASIFPTPADTTPLPSESSFREVPIGERGNFVARKIPECVIFEIGIQTHSYCTETNSFTIYCVAGNFSWEFDFADFGFSGVAGKNHEFGFRTVLMGIPFRGIYACTVQVYSMFESNKNGIHMIVFVTLFATNFIEVQYCKKGVNLCWIFIGGSLFSRDLIIADQ